MGNQIFDYRLFLCDPSKQMLCEVDPIDLTCTRTFRDFNELSVKFAYTDDIYQVKVKNDDRFAMIKPLYLFLLETYIGDNKIHSEYFSITDPSNKMDNGVYYKEVTCKASHYTIFNFRLLRSYVNVKLLYDPNSKDKSAGLINYMLADLYNTWTVNIDPSFLNKYHSWNYSFSTFTEVFKDIEKQFNCFVLFDNVNQIINIVKPNYGSDSEIILSDENYIKSMSATNKSNELTTRLYVYGKDIGIEKYNITGQKYIDDFSWLINNGYFDNSPSGLKQALLNHKSLIDSKQGEYYSTKALSGTVTISGKVVTGYGTSFSRELVNGSLIRIFNDTDSDYVSVDHIDSDVSLTLTSNYSGLNTSGNIVTCSGYVGDLDNYTSILNIKNNELAKLKAQADVLQDIMKTEEQNNLSTTTTYSNAFTQFQSKQSEIENKNIEIRNIGAQIDVINTKITELQSSLSYENNFTTHQLNELNSYIREGRLELNTVDNELNLYNYAVQYISLKSNPAVDIELDLIDFLSSEEFVLDWEKLILGNFVYLDCIELGYDYYQTRIVKITHNKFNNTLNISMSNTDKLNSDLLYLDALLVQSSQAANTLQVNQSNYSQYTQDKNNIIYSGNTINTSSNPVQINDYNYINHRGFQGKDLSGVGIIKLENDKLVISKDGGETFNTLLSGNGLHLETNNTDPTKVNSRVYITGETGFQLDIKDPISGEYGNAIYLGMDNSDPISPDRPALFIDNGFISLSNGLNKIYIDPNNGIKIQLNIGVDGVDDWIDMLYIGNDGILNIIGANVYSGGSGGKIAFEDDGIVGYDSNNQLNGIKIAKAVPSIGGETIEYYKHGVKVGEISEFGGIFALTPGSDTSLAVGDNGKNSFFYGNCDFSNADGISFKNAVSGTFVDKSGKSITVTNGIITNIS